MNRRHQKLGGFGFRLEAFGQPGPSLGPGLRAGKRPSLPDGGGGLIQGPGGEAGEGGCLGALGPWGLGNGDWF